MSPGHYVITGHVSGNFEKSVQESTDQLNHPREVRTFMSFKVLTSFVGHKRAERGRKERGRKERGRKERGRKEPHNHHILGIK